MKKVYDSLAGKLFTILLTVALIVVSVAGCKEDSGNHTTDTSRKTSSENSIDATNDPMSGQSTTGEPSMDTKDVTTDEDGESSGSEFSSSESLTTDETTTVEGNSNSEETTDEPTTKEKDGSNNPTTTKPTTTKPTTEKQTTTEPETTTKTPVVTEQIKLNATSAAGSQVSVKNGITIDYSYAKSKGYFMVQNSGNSSVACKVQIIDSAGTKYNYNLNTDGKYEAFIFPCGDGTYTVKVFQYNSSNGKWTGKITESIAGGNTKDGYTYSTNSVEFNASSKAIAKSYEICAGLTNDEAKAKAIFKFIVDNIEYDWDRYSTGASSRYPNADTTLKNKSGVCSDYANLMAVMCRAQRIPTKMIYGYIYPGVNGGEAYHAWNKVYYNGKWNFYDATKNKTSTGSVTYTDSEFF